MNVRWVLGRIGHLALLQAGIFALLGGLALAVWPSGGDRAFGVALLLTGLLSAAAGWIGRSTGRVFERTVSRRTTIFLVALSWLLSCVAWACPYWLAARLPAAVGGDRTGLPRISFVDALFEATSGLTTTGATILSGLEAMPPSLLLYRALSQWLGGLGILVLLLAILPAYGVSGRVLLGFEFSGPRSAAVQTTVGQRVRRIAAVYLALSLAQVGLLVAAGIGAFDAISLTATTVSSGGFAPTDASLSGAAFATAPVRMIFFVFLVLAGVNMETLVALVRGRFREVWREREWKAYLAIIAVAIAAALLVSAGSATRPSVSDVAVTMASAASTTGFLIVDYELWPGAAAGLVMLLPLIGGCAGSTAGGLKVGRVLVVAAVVLGELRRAVRPEAVQTVRIGSSVVDETVRLGVLAYVVGTLALLGIASFALALFEGPEASLVEAVSAAVGCFTTYGPALGRFGPTESFAPLSDPSKLLLATMMLLGRLEIFALAALALPSFWRRR